MSLSNWSFDSHPAPKKIENADCPIHIVPRDDGTWGLRFAGDHEIVGTFSTPEFAAIYARKNWTTVIMPPEQTRGVTVLSSSPDARMREILTSTAR